VVGRHHGRDHPRSKKVLLVKRSDNGAWTAVTGIVEPGENPADCAAREVREETGVEARATKLALVHVTQPTVHVNGDQAQYLRLRSPLALELVAEPAHRHQVYGVGRVAFNLGPQPLDVDIERLGIADIIRAPDPIDQLSAGQHPPAVAH